MHSILAVLYTIINLSPTMRTSHKALQVACIVNEQDSKAAGMDAVLNGGETSIGAQLRRLGTPQTKLMRAVAGLGSVARDISYHAVAYAADFPAAAQGLAAKGSTSAHRYDRKSTIDQRHEEYGTATPFSLLDTHREDGRKQPFKRVTHKMFRKWLADAASLTNREERIAYLTDKGLDESAFEFDGVGGYELKFALARIIGLDWLDGNSHDWMHTSLLGPVSVEIALSQFTFIRIDKYYTRPEINDYMLHEYDWPQGHAVPEFGAYIEEGMVGTKPSPTAHAHFTAAQSRHWMEYGTQVMEGLFAKKVRAGPIICYARVTRVTDASLRPLCPHNARVSHTRSRIACCVARSTRVIATVRAALALDDTRATCALRVVAVRVCGVVPHTHGRISQRTRRIQPGIPGWRWWLMRL
jgi:hypothetical protein